MKQVRYILFTLGVLVAMSSCGGNDAIDQRMRQSNAFVTFDTRSGAVYTIPATEGKDVVVSITVASYKGASMTVDFEVLSPSTTDPASARYELFNMDGTSLAANTLTFPEGTGSQSFLFRATDNENLDGSREFSMRITDNSADYRIGVNHTGEGSTIRIGVADDDHPLKDWTGVWTVKEEAGQAPEDWWFDVTIAPGEKDDELIIKDFPIFSNPVITGDIVIVMDVEAGTVVLNSNPSIPSGYGVIQMGRYDGESLLGEPVTGVINEDGTFVFNGDIVFGFAPGGNNTGLLTAWGSMMFVR